MKICLVLQVFPTFYNILRHGFYYRQSQKRKSITREPGKYWDRGKYFSKISSHVGIVFILDSTESTPFCSSWNSYSPNNKIHGESTFFQPLTRAGIMFFKDFGLSQMSGFPFKRAIKIKNEQRKSISIFKWSRSFEIASFIVIMQLNFNYYRQELTSS